MLKQKLGQIEEYTIHPSKICEFQLIFLYIFILVILKIQFFYLFLTSVKKDLTLFS